MLFTSWTFLPFILIVLSLYYLLPQRGQNRLLLVASYVFYGAWDYRFLLLMIFTTLVDYSVARLLDRTATPSRRKWLVVASCTTNLSILGFFKYFNFFLDNAIAVLHGLGIQAAPRYLTIILPLGVSFYTFQEMAYVIDVYRRRIPAVTSLLDFALFVSFFPQLVAGPIQRAEHIIPQLLRRRVVTRDHLVQGCWLVLWGFFKKLVIADNLALLVDSVFGAPAAPALAPASGAVALLAVYAFAYQIYCDFSGYTDIARGLAKLMGIELAINFNLPYLAVNPSDFWRRWHISLSTWLRDYLYIPLGGNRYGRWKTYRNLMITMVLGGIWHGAAWNFVFWGAYHAVILAVHRLLVTDLRGGAARTHSRLFTVCTTVAMFHLTCLGWLLFRAGSMQQVWDFLSAICSPWKPDQAVAGASAVVVACAVSLWLVEMWIRNADDPRPRPGWQVGLGPLACAALAASIVVFSPPVTRQFIYFQF